MVITCGASDGNYIVIHKSSYLLNGARYERIQDIPFKDKSAMGVPFNIFVDNQSGAAHLFSIVSTLEKSGYLGEELQVGSFDNEEELNRLIKKCT